MRKFSAVMSILIVLAAVEIPVPAQTGASLGADSAQQQRPQEIDPALKRMEEKRRKELNKQRQQELQKDTDKLLQLATELKAEVDKSNKDTLSLDVIRKAKEIEKLAKSVEKKMRGYY